MPYPYKLPSDSYNGPINAINIRWADGAIMKLQKDARDTSVSEATLKAVTEHFLYLLAHRLGSTGVIVRYVIRDQMFLRMPTVSVGQHLMTLA
jgi:hypothetical protein